MPCLHNDYDAGAFKVLLDQATACKSAGKARDAAIWYQDWQADQDLSWSEVGEAGGCFTKLAKRFDLTEEFSENGII